MDIINCSYRYAHNEQYCMKTNDTHSGNNILYYIYNFHTWQNALPGCQDSTIVSSKYITGVGGGGTRCHLLQVLCVLYIIFFYILHFTFELF